MKSKKTKRRRHSKWLKRDILVCPYLTLCLSENDYFRMMKHMKVEKPWPVWVNSDCDGTTHMIENEGDRKTAEIVCLNPLDPSDTVSVHSLIAHEAVHVWQHTCEVERIVPCKELEALGIQVITWRLIEDYERQRCDQR